MRRLLVLVLGLLCPLASAARQLPPPLGRPAECGPLLPCLPAQARGLAANLRLGLLLDGPASERAMGFGAWLSLSASLWRWGEAGVWLAGGGANPADPQDRSGVRWSLGPLGLFALLTPPFLQHLGGEGGAGGLSLGLHTELAVGRAPFDGRGELFESAEAFSFLAGWEWWRLRGDLVAGYQQADGASYRGAQVGMSLWLRLGRGVYLGGEGLARVGSRDELHEAHGAIGLRLLDDSGLALGASGTWRVPLRDPAARTWRAMLGFGVSYGPGYDSRWLRELLRLPEWRFALPRAVPPPALPAPPLRVPPPGPSCFLDPLGGPPLHLSSLERAQDPVSMWRSYSACRVAGYQQRAGYQQHAGDQQRAGYPNGLRLARDYGLPRTGEHLAPLSPTAGPPAPEVPFGPPTPRGTVIAGGGPQPPPRGRGAMPRTGWRTGRGTGWEQGEVVMPGQPLPGFPPRGAPRAPEGPRPPGAEIPSIGPVGPPAQAPPPEAARPAPPSAEPLPWSVRRESVPPALRPAPAPRRPAPAPAEPRHSPIERPAAERARPAAPTPRPAARPVAEAEAEVARPRTDCPNPWGCEGKPDHRAAVEQLRQQAEQEFPDQSRYQIRVNKSIQKEEGIPRRPDVSVIDTDTGRVVKVYEAARANADGVPPVSRERKKVDQYNGRGIPVEVRIVR